MIHLYEGCTFVIKVLFIQTKRRKNKKEGDIIPRIPKKDKELWQYFLDENGRIKYNATCRRCVNDCKQSYRATIIQCTLYKSKRSKKI